MVNNMLTIIKQIPIDNKMLFAIIFHTGITKYVNSLPITVTINYLPILNATYNICIIIYNSQHMSMQHIIYNSGFDEYVIPIISSKYATILFTSYKVKEQQKCNNN